mgnify:CR=1 FL=1
MSIPRQSDSFVSLKKEGALRFVSAARRLKIVIAYRGTAYHGWQVQPTPPTWKGHLPEGAAGIPTVQETLQRTIGSVVGHPVTVCGSSRTDAGVHAHAQVAHLDTSAVQIPPENLRQAVNARLPGDILIRSVEQVNDSFDAISMTTSKRYEYIIWNEPDRPVFQADLAWHRWQPLDDTAIRAAAALLVGTHDFASFAKPGHGREHTVRTITGIDVARDGPRLIISVEGTGFLWQMVRIIVGTLIEVGLARRPASEMTPMLQAKDRRAAGPTAPAHGLYLHSIQYRSSVVGE